MTNPWKSLGVEKHATDKEIKLAYKKKSFEFHPDRVSGDGKLFLIVKDAYLSIKDAESRKKYIKTNKEYSIKEYGRIFTDKVDNYGVYGKGNDLCIKSEITFYDACQGGDLEVVYSRKSRCIPCAGSGNEHKDLELCKYCNGKGVIGDEMRGEALRECGDCHGTGIMVMNKCKVCNGIGSTVKELKIHITISAGINDGDVIEVVEKGGDCRWAGYGDLYVYAKIENNKYTDIKDMNLVITVPITIGMAILGGDIRVGGFLKTYLLKIKPETRHGQVYVIKGEGIRNKGGVGDLLCNIEIDIPSRLGREGKDLVLELERLSRKNNYIGLNDIRNWKKYMKDMYGE